MSDDFIEDAKVWATMPVPGAQFANKQAARLDAMGIDELAEHWRALQYVGLRDQTDSIWETSLYFDALPHNAPERAFDLALAVLRTERDRAVLMQLGDKFMCALMQAHAPALVGRIEREAETNPQLRWLIGGSYWWTPDQAIKARLKAIADIDAWRTDGDALKASETPVDFASLSVDELARHWIEQSGRPEKDQQRVWDELRDYEREIVENDPDRMLDMILAVLKVETNTRLLGYLAAGPLEDVISLNTIGRVEREAAANEAFRHLLGGVWYSSAPDELRHRLDAIIQGRHW